MITYQEEEVKDVIHEIKPLLQKHYEEIAMYKDKIAFNPDYDKYLQLAELGIINLITVRDGECLIGYFITMIMPHLHYKDDIFANVDILYLHEDYRGSMVGIKMFKYAEAILKKKGVAVIVQHMKVLHDFGSMLERIGYTKAETTYSKYIGDK